VLAGPNHHPAVCASLKPQDVKKLKVCALEDNVQSILKSLVSQGSNVLFEKSDGAGWSLKAEVVFSGSKVEGIMLYCTPIHALCKAEPHKNQ
jgi:hypothetical protein